MADVTGVPRLGPKAFEQCAGFLRIRDGADPLDTSAVHPEAYPVVRRILLDAALLVIPASALWALLPLVAARRLGLDAGGYGLLLAALGLGALIGAVALPRVRARLSDARMLLLAFCVFSAVLVVIATVRVTVVVALASPQAWHGSRCSPPPARRLRK